MLYLHNFNIPPHEMATSTQQKQELFKAIRATAEDLRAEIDAIIEELEQ